MSARHVCIGAFLLVCLSTATTHADSAVLYPDADAQIYAGFPNDEYGTTTLLGVGKPAGDRQGRDRRGVQRLLEPENGCLEFKPARR
jgi:hypothetical protein